MSLEARWNKAAISFVMLGAGVWAHDNEGMAAAMARTATHAWSKALMIASRKDGSHSVDFIDTTFDRALRSAARWPRRKTARVSAPARRAQARDGACRLRAGPPAPWRARPRRRPARARRSRCPPPLLESLRHSW